MLAAPPADAQTLYKRVPGTPSVTVPGYNIEIGVWAYDTGIVGGAVGLFELRPDGNWYQFGGAPPQANLAQTVAKAGGAHAYLMSILPDLQAELKKRFPPLADAPTGTDPTHTGDPNTDAVNAELFKSFTFKAKPDGTVTLGTK